MGRVTQRRRVVRIRDGAVGHRPDTLATEEPLEIRLNGNRLAVTMRTPGDDLALAAGFLVSEGVIGRAAEVRSIAHCAGGGRDGAGPPAGARPPGRASVSTRPLVDAAGGRPSTCPPATSWVAAGRAGPGRYPPGPSTVSRSPSSRAPPRPRRFPWRSVTTSLPATASW